jgi:hypothetical protein
VILPTVPTIHPTALPPVSASFLTASSAAVLLAPPFVRTEEHPTSQKVFVGVLLLSMVRIVPKPTARTATPQPPLVCVHKPTNSTTPPPTAARTCLATTASVVLRARVCVRPTSLALLVSQIDVLRPRVMANMIPRPPAAAVRRAIYPTARGSARFWLAAVVESTRAAVGVPARWAEWIIVACVEMECLDSIQQGWRHVFLRTAIHMARCWSRTININASVPRAG